jgi:transporter family protein
VIIGGLLGGMIGQIFYFKSLQTWEASRAVPIAGSYPLFTFLLSFLILKEPITATKVLGILSVIAGLYLLRLS